MLPFFSIGLATKRLIIRRSKTPTGTDYALNVKHFSLAKGWHPLVENMEHYFDLITDEEKSSYFYRFFTLEDLAWKTHEPCQRMEEGYGKWRNMLACIPSAEKVHVVTRREFPYHLGTWDHVETETMNKDRVRLGQIVDLIREELEQAPWELDDSYQGRG